MGRTGVAGRQGGGCAVGARAANFGTFGATGGPLQAKFLGGCRILGEPPSRAHAPQGLGEFWGMGAAILELVLGRKRTHHHYYQ
jgi:hypothetical protein